MSTQDQKHSLVGVYVDLELNIAQQKIQVALIFFFRIFLSNVNRKGERRWTLRNQNSPKTKNYRMHFMENRLMDQKI